ncbi:MAG: DUF1566 domain-containing protein [Deltaproteobacteria bacterium]|nr:DUF1566 domain-containing protein [Deltaproteobacteria bacterium]
MDIGTRIGSYTITRELGSGGMAMVYAARHTGIGTEHALKVLLPNYASQPRTVERFRQEARAQFRMRHRNIVQVTDFVEDGKTLALVMDLIGGKTLHEAMQRRPGPWPFGDVAAVMLPVLDAMAYAHSEGIDGQPVVHRDLKPENVMLDLAGDRPFPGVPKVMDFGIAKVLGESNVGTKTNARMGTAAYMAPEQFRNAKDVTAAADVWALGMMLWQLLAGRLPIDPDDQVALLEMYTGRTTVPRLDTVGIELPREVVDAVATALNVDPNKRFQSAAALLRAVQSGAEAWHRFEAELVRRQEKEKARAEQEARQREEQEARLRVEQEQARVRQEREALERAHGHQQRGAVAQVTSTSNAARTTVNKAWVALAVLIALLLFFLAYLAAGPRESSEQHAQPVAFAGLSWQGETAAQPMKWADAYRYCEALDVGNHSDWRLPNHHELTTVVDKQRVTAPLVVAEIHENTRPAGLYWSGTRNNSDTVVYALSFKDGELGSAQTAEYGWVRCVRGEQLRPPAPMLAASAAPTSAPAVDKPPSNWAQVIAAAKARRGDTDALWRTEVVDPTDNPNHFVDNGDGTVFDPDLGLTWQKEDNGKDVNWKRAKAYCKSLTLRGKSDWRLPGILELVTLADATKPQGARVATAFPPDSAWNWSATAYHPSPSSDAWGVGFHYGNSNYVDISSGLRARCVR